MIKTIKVKEAQIDDSTNLKYKSLILKTYLENSVFEAFFKTVSSGSKRGSLGREFHNPGAATEKVLSLITTNVAFPT